MAMTIASRRNSAHQRLWISFGISAALHAVAIAMLASLLFPLHAPMLARVGQASVVEVLLRDSTPAATVAPAAVEPTPEPANAPPLIEPAPAPPKPPAPVTESRSVAARVEAAPAAAVSSGYPTPNDSMPETVADDAPTPPGDVAVGAAENAEPMGRTQSLRLAQRFPQRIAKPPRLKAPLIVPYPVRAARSWRDARIAVLLIIDANGKVLETTLSPEDPLFAPTVRDALNKAEFLPAEADGAAVSYWVIMEFVFTMRRARPAKVLSAG
jgi:periplasmic protein TonB